MTPIKIALAAAIVKPRANQTQSTTDLRDQMV
jgi:hypothetical protein